MKRVEYGKSDSFRFAEDINDYHRLKKGMIDHENRTVQQRNG